MKIRQFILLHVIESFILHDDVLFEEAEICSNTIYSKLTQNKIVIVLVLNFQEHITIISAES